MASEGNKPGSGAVVWRICPGSGVSDPAPCPGLSAATGSRRRRAPRLPAQPARLTLTPRLTHNPRADAQDTPLVLRAISTPRPLRRLAW
jgi:hypothetical protein